MLSHSHFVSSALVLAILLPGLIAGAALGNNADMEDNEVYLPDDGEILFYPRERRVPGQPVAVAATSGDVAAPNDVKWTLGLGVLSNMQQFFDSLRTNLESLESLPHEEKEALLGQTASSSAACGTRQRQRTSSRRRRQRDQGPAFRPKATAAYLHALRNHRPSHKIRNFVSESEPATLRGSNHYDPNWLWTGLGRKR